MEEPGASSRDKQWAARISSGNRAAFEALFRAYYEDLCEFGWQYVRSPEVAEEFVQDLFLHIWKQRHRWVPQGPVKAYLYSAIRNKALNYLKHRRVEERWEAQAVHQAVLFQVNPEDELYHKELMEVVQKTLEELPERRRLIFILSRQHSLTYSEIAALLDISVKTVETQMGRALKFLRTRLSLYLPVAA